MWPARCLLHETCSCAFEAPPASSKRRAARTQSTLSSSLLFFFFALSARAAGDKVIASVFVSNINSSVVLRIRLARKSRLQTWLAGRSRRSFRSTSSPVPRCTRVVHITEMTRTPSATTTARALGPLGRLGGFRRGVGAPVKCCRWAASGDSCTSTTHTMLRDRRRHRPARLRDLGRRRQSTRAGGHFDRHPGRAGSSCTPSPLLASH